MLRLLGRTADADEIDVERRKLWKGRPPRELADLALAQTTSRAALIGYGKAALPPAAERVRELDLDQAAAYLKMAINSWDSTTSRHLKRISTLPSC